MRAALAWTRSTCLAAALALGGCGRSAPTVPAADAPSASAPADYAPARIAPTDAASDLPLPKIAPSTAAAAPAKASSETPRLALAPPVGTDPAKVETPSESEPAALPSPVPIAGGKPPLPTGPVPPATLEVAFTPRDECAALPGWKAFRDKLAAAVAAKNGAALAVLADRNVKLDYGGGSGRAELARRLRQTAGLWRDLATILPLGCSVEGGLPALPWYFWRIPTSVDPTTTMLVTGDAVALRAAPTANAQVVASLDWPMVLLTAKSFDPAARFTRIRTRTSAQEGYVETRRLRSLLARRIIAEHSGDQWRITAIVAGD